LIIEYFFAQGIIHAQDSLWQMDFQRRVGAGRLSEILGKEVLEEDKLLRTWGFYRAAQADYASLSPTAKTAIDAYVNGINAYLATKPPLPLEFTLLGYSPEPWKPADVMVWAKMLAFELAINRDTELQRYHLLASGLSYERIAQLMPLYPDKDSARFSQIPPNPPFSKWGIQLHEADKKQASALLAMAALFPTSVEASNNWVLGGSRTTSHKPLLANDPHLGLSIPSSWHLMHLEAPNYNVIGATLPGIPWVIIGRNTHIAWGVTSLHTDVEDLYVLIDRNNGSGYFYQNEVKPYQIRTEVINVKGEPPVQMKVRETVYGPVISDVVEISGAAPLALRWTGHHPDDTTLDAYVALNQAQNWTDFKAAMKYYLAPGLNFVYADIKGNIGHFAAGLLPIRKSGHSGLYPMPGNGDWDWQGYIPFEELPQYFNPEQDYLFTANHKITPPDYPYPLFLEGDSNPIYRAARIEQMIRSREKHSPADMLTMQLDTVSLLYKSFKPVLKNLTPTSERGQQWRERLLAWDGNVSPDSQEATVFQAWYLGLSGLSKSETGEEYWYYPRYFLNAMQQGDVACEALKMTCLDYASQVLEQTLARWDNEIPAWGQLHQAAFTHPVLSYTPLAFLSDRQIPVGGDDIVFIFYVKL
jgi:penicillin amidase